MVKRVFKILILLIGAVTGLLVILIVMASIWILHSMNPSLIKTPSHTITLDGDESSGSSPGKIKDSRAVLHSPTHSSVLQKSAVSGPGKSPPVGSAHQGKEMADFAASLEWAKGLVETYQEMTPCQSLCNPSRFQYDKNDPRKIEAFYQKYGAEAFNDPKFVFAILVMANMEPVAPNRIIGILLDYYKHPSAMEASKAMARISIEIPRYLLRVKLGYDRGRKNDRILKKISKLSHKCHDARVDLEEIYNECVTAFDTFEL